MQAVDQTHPNDFYFGAGIELVVLEFPYLTRYTQKSGNGVRKYGAPTFDFKKLYLLLAYISTTQNAGAHFMQSDYSRSS